MGNDIQTLFLSQFNSMNAYSMQARTDQGTGFRSSYRTSGLLSLLFHQAKDETEFKYLMNWNSTLMTYNIRIRRESKDVPKASYVLDTFISISFGNALCEMHFQGQEAALLDTSRKEGNLKEN